MQAGIEGCKIVEPLENVDANEIQSNTAAWWRAFFGKRIC